MWIPEIEEECDLEMSDLEDRLNETLDEYCESLSKQEEMTRPVTDDDPWECEGSPFMWADKASRLIDAEINRLWAILTKYYPKKEDQLSMSVQSSWYREL